MSQNFNRNQLLSAVLIQIENGQECGLCQHYLLTCSSMINHYGQHHEGLGFNQCLRKSSKFLDRLFTLVHITHGQPARATELESSLVRNTSQSLRSVYIIGNMVILILRYSKTQNFKWFATVVARSLPPQVSEIFLK